jgi:hypothetical protein
MMQPIYDEFGDVAGWLHGERVLDRYGIDRAVIVQGYLVSYRGTHLGYFLDGYFRDPAGDAVAFVAGALGGPPLPVLRVPSGPPAIGVAPPPPPLPAIPSAARPTRNWSRMGWGSFLSR